MLKYAMKQWLKLYRVKKSQNSTCFDIYLDTLWIR